MDDNTRDKNDKLSDSGSAPSRESVENEVGQNNVDVLLESDGVRGEKNDEQTSEEPAGENLDKQNPTQDQTSGEDDVGGFSDEEYSGKEYLNLGGEDEGV